MTKVLRQADVRVLAQDAVVVTPVTARNEPMTSSTLMGGTQVKTIPVQEIVIAVNPEEAAKISEALAMHLQIDCVIRSGRPDDPGPALETPPSNPLNSSVIVLDTILGSKRDTQVFSNSGSRVTVPPTQPAGGVDVELPPPPPPAPRNGLGARVEPRLNSAGRGVSTAGLP
jgi:hypothetical protein